MALPRIDNARTLAFGIFRVFGQLSHLAGDEEAGTGRCSDGDGLQHLHLSASVVPPGVIARLSQDDRTHRGGRQMLVTRLAAWL